LNVNFFIFRRHFLIISAVIPLTDSRHSPLPLHFAVDPGPDFRWNCDEYAENTLETLSLPPAESLGLMCAYLEVVRVTLPDAFLEHSPSPAPQNKKGTKGIGGLGKKIKKNIGKLARSGSLRRNQQHHDEVDRSQRIVSNAQSFILSAYIHTSRPLPYQTEMVDNYLHEARKRFDVERERLKRQREEKAELEERRKREIYLNGGYLDCRADGCDGRGAEDADFYCEKCYEERSRAKRYVGKSVFYSEESPLTVKLPETREKTTLMSAPAVRPACCLTVGCDFFGRAETDHLCSKCYTDRLTKGR